MLWISGPKLKKKTVANHGAQDLGSKVPKPGWSCGHHHGTQCPRCTPYPGDTLAARLQHPAQRSKMTRPNKGPNRRSRGIIRGSNIPINQPAHKHSQKLFQFHLRLSFPPRKLISTSPPTCGPTFLFELISKWKWASAWAIRIFCLWKESIFKWRYPEKYPTPSNLKFHLKCASKMSSLQSRTWNHPSSTKIGLFKAVAKLDTIRTTRCHRLHDDGKGFGAGEMIHLLPRLTLKTKRRHKNASKHNCVCVSCSDFVLVIKSICLMWAVEVVKKGTTSQPKLLLRLRLQLPHTERTARRPDALTASCCTCLSRRFCIPCAVVLPRKPMYSDKASATWTRTPF